MIQTTTNLQTQRIECVQKQIQKTHDPYEWALEGTLENIGKVDEFLREKDIRGYLFRGCLEKELSRKDIDVLLEYCLEDTLEKSYKILGVDWWYPESYRPMIGINVNGITTEVFRTRDHYQQKETGGLILPKKFIQENPKSELIELLYSPSDSKQLKGGDERWKK